MNEVIKLAIKKGGYNYRGIKADNFDYVATGSLEDDVQIISKFNGYLVMKAVIASDPFFWQALGKALGWDDDIYYYENMVDEMDRDRIWLYHAHQYFDLVLTGGDVEKWWKELLTDSK